MPKMIVPIIFYFINKIKKNAEKIMNKKQGANNYTPLIILIN